VAEATELLIKKDFRGIINFGGPDSVSIFDFAKMVKINFGLRGSVQVGSLLKNKKYKNIYPQNMTLNTAFARSLGIKFSHIEEKLKKITDKIGT